MDELYQKLASVSSFDLWGNSSNSNKKSFEVTEGWLNHATGKVKHKTRSVTSDELADWLAEKSRIETKSGSAVTHTLVLRLVIVDVDLEEKMVFLADSVQKELLQAFGLELAHKYAKSCLTDVSAIPTPQEQPDLRAYSLCFLPKLAAVWSHSQPPTDGPRQHITQGLIYVQREKDEGKPNKGSDAGGGKSSKEDKSSVEKMSEKALLTKFLSSPWDESLYRTAMLPPLLFSLILLATMYMADATIKEKIKPIEGLTEHHNFKSVDEKYSHKDKKKSTREYAQSSAEASGCASKLASAARKGRMVESILRFMTSSIGDETDGEEARQGRFYMSQHVQHLQGRLDTLNVDMEYTLKRVQIQISAKELAIQSYRDSLSMKTLAIVTMFFLPGSFISALFSTQMFDWDAVASKTGSIGLPTTPQFKLYWIITVLLTVATFSLYFLWFQLLKRRVREQSPETLSDNFAKISLAEKGTM
ncbi:hypothetical protein ESCO_005070 [Escovopsis weberi]|uniref:Uncharacterized protein n=1 Tax=Escovopsis weberi TaxID=150374 RepID=A0A0M8MYL7_ESCWE|nr:hypothetical protein ESCO_005070 [Escovopsis weberi]